MKCEKTHWMQVQVGELGKIVTGKTPRTSVPENYGGKIPFLTPSDNMLTKYVTATKKSLTEKGVMEVRNCLLPINSVCVSCIGSDLGKVVITTEPTATNQQINSIIVNQEKYDVSFVYYAMLILGKQLNYISKTSTAVPIVNKASFSSYTICCPSLKQQRDIAAVLSSLDDKIELNNKINENLEQQAKALYEAMFIDNPNIEITQGVLSDIAEITMGQSPNGSSYNEEGNGEVFFQGRAEFGFRFPTRRLFTTEPKRMAEANDVLLSVRAPVGDLNMAYEQCCVGRGLSAIHSKDGNSSFLLYTMFALKPQLDVFNGEGTVFGSINKNGLSDLPVNIPCADEIAKFEALVHPMDEHIRANYEENCRLQALRDSLLPKLMSGEVDVSDIQI